MMKAHIAIRAGTHSSVVVVVDRTSRVKGTGLASLGTYDDDDEPTKKTSRLSLRPHSSLAYYSIDVCSLSWSHSELGFLLQTHLEKVEKALNETCDFHPEILGPTKFSPPRQIQ